MTTQTKQNNTVEHAEENTSVVSQEIKHETTLFAEPVAHIGSFPVTNALLTSTSAVIIIALLALVIRARLSEIPKGIQNIFEAILGGALTLCDQVTNSRKISTKVFPLAFSVFLFILVNNWLGLLPIGGLGIIETGEHGLSFIPFLRSGTADINTTIALAIMAVLSANLFGIFSIGLWKTFNKYVNLKALGSIFTRVRKEPTVLVVAPVTFFVGILELVGELAKIASLSFRLFGNVFAGEVLLMAMSAILPYLLPIPFMFLEIFVGLIQALIFSILVLVYFTIAAQDHDSHEEHGEKHEHHAAHA
ncbi:MAG: ATP synthase subunit a [Parcubacteria group bacterium GW2011_GWA2_47_16]|nr:MAG: ATP synthase subunit a [Parcubacteria group bacterium GW2011_GWA2_47_16]